MNSPKSEVGFRNLLYAERSTFHNAGHMGKRVLDLDHLDIADLRGNVTSFSQYPERIISQSSKTALIGTRSLQEHYGWDGCQTQKRADTGKHSIQ